MTSPGHLLAPWSGFYAIIGSAAAALTGLMFVVITLVAGGSRSRANREGISTFSTPTLVHFSVALVTAALLTMPWTSLAHAAVVLGLAGLVGVVHAIRVIQHSDRQRTYEPDFEDRIWYAAVPLVTYVAYVGSAFALGLGFDSDRTLFALAFCSIALLFLGIRNAWDVVIYIAVELQEDEAAPAATPPDVTASVAPADEPPADARVPTVATDEATTATL